MKTKRIKSVIGVALGAALLLTGCSKDEAPQGGAQPDTKITTINVTAGGFAAATAGEGTEKTSAETRPGLTGEGVYRATVTIEDAGTVYTRAAISAGQGSNASGSQAGNDPGAQSALATRATDQGYATTFDNGDKIGLTVVKADRTIVLKNTVLTYSDANNWTLPSETELWYYEGAEYIAYYPYDAAMAGVITNANPKTGAGIEAAIVEAFEPKIDQSIYADYTASDLMMWRGTANISGTTPTLDIVLKHTMGLMIVEPKGLGSLKPENADISITVGPTTYTPYAMLDAGNSTDPAAIVGNADGSYRVLVKPAPNLSSDISARYGISGVTVEWRGEREVPAAARYFKLNVTSAVAVEMLADAAQITVTNVAAGDISYAPAYVFPDIPQGGAVTITQVASGTNPLAYTGDAQGLFITVPGSTDPVIGPTIYISYTLTLGGITSTEKTKTVNYTGVAKNALGGAYYQNGIATGMVYIVNNGTAGTGRAVSLKEENTDDKGVVWGPFGYDIGNLTGSNFSTTDGLTNMDIVMGYCSGNGNRESHTLSDFPAFAWVDALNLTGTAYSTKSTGIWYLPSYNELNNTADGLYHIFNTDRSKFNTLLTSIGGTALDTFTYPYYWSSTQYDDYACYVLFYNGTTGEGPKNSLARVRAVLAF